MRWKRLLSIALVLVPSSAALPQSLDARALLEAAAEAMGGLERLQALESLTMTGFGQNLNQQGGANPSPDPHAPSKWQATNGVARDFDLVNGRARYSDRRSYLFPFAGRQGLDWVATTRIETGVQVLDHPLTALLAALDADTRLGPVTAESGDTVVEFTIESGETLWLAVDTPTMLPSFVRWVAPSTTLGDLTMTAHFTGYLPFDDVRLPVGLSTSVDWRNLTIATLHVDGYEVDAGDFEPVPPAPQPEPRVTPEAVATEVAEGVWDVRYGGNGGAVVEFDDHLTMFEAYASEEATFARLDLANTLVPGKRVTEVIVSHHHFDHSGGLRAAVSRGLRIIARRGNEQLFREMVARPAPNFPDALARNPQPLDFVPVDEHLVLEDDTMRVDVYHAVGHLHMAEAVFAYIPRHRIFLEGDFTTYDWDYHWWGDAYLDSVERYGLDPVINIPVHGIVTGVDDVLEAIGEQVDRAREFCALQEGAGLMAPGCPVKYQRD